MAPLTWQWAAIQGMRRDQIAARVRLRTLRALGGSRPFAAPRRRPPSLDAGGDTRDLSLHAPGLTARAHSLAAALEQAAVVTAGNFRFLNEERPWRFPVDWQAAGASRLWRFHLHYFDDAPALALTACVTGDPQLSGLFCRLAADWLAGNPIGAGDGWHPYPLSRRIPNWIYAIELLGLRRLAETAPALDSLRDQARFLSRHLEFDALGNHLLANARALLFAGSFVLGEEARRWWATAEGLFERELAEQFLADGGHFERSPMYHALVLQDLLECAALFRRRGEIPGWLRETILGAERWLFQMCHPDGRVALFNDCTLEGPAHPELAAFCGGLFASDPGSSRPGWRQLAWLGEAGAASSAHGPAAADFDRAAAGRDPSLTALPESGYFILRDPAARHALFFDAGDPCPSYIPAHAHADLLSYELSLFGRRVIVDSGVCEYEAGPWRDYCRSTRAHNTVQVDGHDQSEVWGSFRLGRRAHPLEVRWSTGGGRAEVSATHSGYCRLRGEVVHRRTITYDASAYRVLDRVTGSGCHRVESFLHFHPEMDIDLEAEGLVARGQGVRLAVRFTGGARADLRCGEDTPSSPLQGWYCPEFGVRQPGPVVVLTREGTLPAQIGYEIEPLKG